MKIVVDANIFVSALLKDSLTRKLLKDPFFEFYTVDFVRSEFEEHFDEFSKRSGLSMEELILLINGILRNVKVVGKLEFVNKLEMAKRLIDDFDDVPYLALALAMGNEAAIWSNDKDFRKQKLVNVYSTRDLVEIQKQE
jgi:predicted nucleic acid-binding protein